MNYHKKTEVIIVLWKRKNKHRIFSSVDTSKKGIEYAGIKLTDQQFEDICLLNQLSTSLERQNIPIFNVLILLKILGLLPVEEMSNERRKNCNQDFYENFQKKFGKFK